MGCLSDFFHRLKESRLLLDFNIPAGVTVLLPLLMWMIARFVGGNGGDAKGAGQDRGQGVALGFVYFWSLFLFGGIVWYGNRVLETDNKELLKVLMAALIVFTNLALMLAVLTGRLGMQVVGNVAVARGWLGRFPSCMVLTFAFWVLFGSIWSLLLHRRISKLKNRSNNNDYRKQEDAPAV